MSLFASDRTSSETGHVNVIAEIRAREGHESSIRTLMEAMVPVARLEDGCEGYHLLEDTKHPGTFYTYEEWESEGKLNVHLVGAKETMKKAAGMLVGPPKITVLQHLV